ncbi:MAG: trehalose-phosphatase [Acidobacteria bacterium]|jgi:trehalose 6-phosphate phosphatase|nr:MAG: trehalose-phosphatase [Acidobacteriota bacterium]
MKALERQISYAAFLDQLRSASTRVLLLDYDGTLAPFTVDRSLALPYPNVAERLMRIMKTGTRVVLISGRPAREVVSLIGIDPHPEIWGSHSLERLKADGSYEICQIPLQQQAGLSLAAQLLQAVQLDSQTEVKPGSVAVHWRGLTPSEVVEIKTKIRHLWLPLVTEYPLSLLEFDGGLEIRIPGRDKGDAIRAILTETKPDAAVAYLGDDQTDEDAFRALKGRGLTALVRPQSRPTAADIWLQPPQELIEFFDDWLHAVGGEQ